MPDKSKLISQVVRIAENTGLTEITPIELINGGHLIIPGSPSDCSPNSRRHFGERSGTRI